MSSRPRRGSMVEATRIASSPKTLLRMYGHDTLVPRRRPTTTSLVVHVHGRPAQPARQSTNGSAAARFCYRDQAYDASGQPLLQLDPGVQRLLHPRRDSTNESRCAERRGRTLSKFFVPTFEKLLAEAPSRNTTSTPRPSTPARPARSPFFTSRQGGVVNDAVRDAGKNNPLISPAIGSILDSTGHRDELTRTDATYK